MSQYHFPARQLKTRQRICAFVLILARQSVWSGGLSRCFADVVCWHGPGVDWGGIPTEDTSGKFNTPLKQLPAGIEHTIFISGDGCLGCTVGHSCSFYLRFASDVYFPNHNTAFREMMGTLTGPSLAHVRAVPHPSHQASNGSAFLLSYQVWDAGDYTFTLDGDCTPNVNGGKGSHRLVQLNLRVSDPANESALKSHPPMGPSTPCDFGQFGRWLYTGKGRKSSRGEPGVPPMRDSLGYEFLAFPCAGAFLKMEEFAAVMLKKGVREISMVGDSHQRSLFTHLQMMADGSFPVAGHADRKWEIADPVSGQSLKMNFYWMEGVFYNGEYGCARKKRQKGAKWPQYSNSSDVVILEAASWTIRLCEDVVKAYSQHVPEFLQWNINLPHKSSTKFFWRTSPPFPSGHFGCGGGKDHRMSSNIMWTNEFARSLTIGYGMDVIDFWPIEAPRHRDTCFQEMKPGQWRKDAHFSCLYEQSTKVYGQVGEADAFAFMHILMNM